jgi:hypothetical protein
MEEGFMRFRASFRTLAMLSAVGAVIASAMPASATTDWYSGQRHFGQVTVEPAIDDSTGNQIFLLTPDNVPTPSQAAERSHAPLYLPLYPTNSTIPANSLNCQPTNCDHSQTFSYPVKGHDHLVGMASTKGDFNVAWDVVVVGFTQKGFADGAIHNRILTLTQLNNALASGDVFAVNTGFSFNCSITAEATYLNGTP